jgi:hypothetical protein
MKKIKFGTGFTIFIIFFGIAVVEAFDKQDWIWVVLWILIGMVFLYADNMKSKSV